jgi:two-component system, LuxR family, response regulator FixJ
MIYLIDDDPSVIRSFSLLLRSAGIDHKSFGSADEFLSVYKSDAKDLLVLDMNLPGMNGCDLLKKFSKENNHMPVIIITAHEDPQVRELCKQYGVIAFLRKPVDGNALLDIIRYNTSA